MIIPYIVKKVKRADEIFVRAISCFLTGLFIFEKFESLFAVPFRRRANRASCRSIYFLTLMNFLKAEVLKHLRKFFFADYLYAELLCFFEFRAGGFAGYDESGFGSNRALAFAAALLNKFLRLAALKVLQSAS